MSLLKDIQYFVHKYYEPIKLVLLTILLGITALTLMSVYAADARQAERDRVQAEERSRDLVAQNKAISAALQAQHDHQDERQACFFNLFISYTNTREPITEEDATFCQVMPDTSLDTSDPQPTTSPTTQPQPTAPVQPTKPGKQKKTPRGAM